jgi:alpha-beta hydrolase superfamily lysophospholipase
MVRALLVAMVCALVWSGNALAAPWTKTDQKVTASDGAELATTLYEPATAPPVGGWPAIVMFHGIGGTRASMNQIAEQAFAPNGYAVLTADFRGHGQSGGLFSVDGPREVQDVRDLFTWLTSRPEIDRGHVGAWGISLGGGAVWASLKAGVPFAAAEVYETWVDLYAALAPHDLSKSGAIFQFLSSVPAERTAPEVNAIKSDALQSKNLVNLRAFADARSVLDALPQVKTPVMIFQGRRDFAFGLEQGLTAYHRLGGPKAIYIGDFGHAPSTFPGPDAEAMFLEALHWFDRYLMGTAALTPEPVRVAPDPWKGSVAAFGALPRMATAKTKTLKVRKTFGWAGKAVLTFPSPSRSAMETFGAPIVTVTASTKTRAPQLVGVLEAVQNGKSTIVSEGGMKLPTRKSFTTSFAMISDATLIPRGAKLRLTLSWTSTAQDSANLLYLTGVPVGSSLTVRRVYMTLPLLARPVSQ